MNKAEIREFLSVNPNYGIVWTLQRGNLSPYKGKDGQEPLDLDKKPLYQRISLENGSGQGTYEIWPIGIPMGPNRQREARLQESITTIIGAHMPRGLGKMMIRNPLNVASEETILSPGKPRDIFALYRFLGGMEEFMEFEERFFKVGNLLYGNEGPIRKTLTDLVEFGRLNPDLIEHMKFGRNTVF